MDAMISEEWKSYVSTYWTTNDCIYVNHLIAEHGVKKTVYLASQGGLNIKKIFYVRSDNEICYLRNIAPYIKDITVLKLKGSGINQYNVELIAEHCTQLRTIHLTVITIVSCKSIKKIYDTNRELKAIVLEGHECDNIYNIDNPCLRILPKKLHVLILISCNISNKTFMESLLFNKSISSLRIDNCVNIPNDFLTRVVKLISNLEFLSHSFVHMVSKYREIHAVPEYSMLSSLILYYNPQLSDKFLELVSKICLELEDLQIGNPPECDAVYTTHSPWHPSDRSTLNLTCNGLTYLAVIDKLKYLALYGLKNDNMVNSLRDLALKSTLERLVIITIDENFSDVVFEMLSLCHSLREFTVLGHVVSEAELIDGIIRIDESVNRVNRLELRIEEESIQMQDAVRFTSPMVDIRLSKCNIFCDAVIRRGYFYHA